MMDIHKILQKLPHRYPFLLVDRVLEVEKNVRIRALKNVTINEPFFQGHFPTRPVMPGVLMLEALAQTAALLAFETQGEGVDENSVYYFVGIDGARFKRPVEPGDQLFLDVQMDRNKGGIYKFNAQALVGEELAVSAQLMCTVRKVS
ncbi:3-hydroxyacyl-ACP dehydratase FabZ [Aquabacterium sp.]|uniref:3-hydroxyacyl-ACP dehydratase FabZ n=1 Tax=Aquabacterium sp. TaxID=1872578 RepID=UPI001B575BC9|nr:3-hydroxyacyl-ACP dehydratase FabZ [Aquabacterium sp.]MBP6612123.1 3-hydroxyacyl-ACP dehydratase FabZ [Aquabacterium sp.]MBP6614613.1 3-hydroxyacyl-ACP dehydratase FabZ [Aquabacterium sp.]MBP7503294.1 3-hydroxyacyl-ACP dehydratase FabZ [Aquabacterium sp.]MCC6218128.1 3-hydroxyacyl-ACP dehydratase FabZ [Aquabacterium sp.]MDD2975365.1 3-hydroxyacyl-ACP dehydratase FabZ [Aquabacterium sp.]